MRWAGSKVALMMSFLSLLTVGLSACSSSQSNAAKPTNHDHSIIKIGTITALTGPYASLGVVTDGLKAYFEMRNAQGGINGHPIKVFVGNDQFNPALTPGVASALVGQDHVQMMCGIAGSADADAIKPYLASQGVPDVAPASGSTDLVIPPTPTEYEVVPAYEPLSAALVKYAVDVLHKTRIGLAYTDDSVGLPALEGVKYEVKQLHATLAATVQFSLTDTSLAPQAAQLKASHANFVILWHVAQPLALLVNDAAQLDYHPTWGDGFFGATSAFVKLTHGSTSGDAYFISPFESGTEPSASTYRATVAKYQPEASISSANVMQGWSLAEACGALIEKATANGKTFNLANITKAANHLSVSNVYLHDLKWTVSDHQGLRSAQVLKQEGSKFVPITSFAPLPYAPEAAG